MERKDFIEILERNRYNYTIENNKIVVNHKGNVDLSFLKELPSGIVFNNGGNVNLNSLKVLPSGIEFNNGGNVYLDSLTKLPSGMVFNNGGSVNLSSLSVLPSGIEFNNGGNVYLSSLTELSSGIVFNNSGYVDLDSLTELPSGIVFNNDGNVNLNSLKVLPSGIEFNNGGYVDLRSLKELPSGIEFNNGGYVFLPNQCKINNPKWKVIDTYLMENTSTKQINRYLIHATEYVGSKNQSYVAEFNGQFSHGKSIKDAIEDLEYKLDNRDLDITIKEIKEKGTININDFRKLTGACREGINEFLSTNPLPKKEMPINEALTFVEGAYGYDKLKKIF